MRRSSQRESILPAIQQSKTHHKPIKDILQDLRSRKMAIESRIKTQNDESELDDRNPSQNEQQPRRMMTEIPFYLSRRSFLHQSNVERFPESNAEKQKSIHQNREDPEEEQEIQQSHRKTDFMKKQVIVIPVVDEPDYKIVKKHSSLPKKQQQKQREFEDVCMEVPVDPKQRTEQNIQELKLYLMENNMFFSKIHDILATCIIKLNKFKWVQKNQVLYRKGEERKSMYIIMWGRIKLFNVELDFRKICQSGEVVGQELLFSITKGKRIVRESAKAISRCFLVELKISNYLKMSEEMTKYGYRLIFHEMESILKRNYITKNWLRGEKDRFQKKH